MAKEIIKKGRKAQSVIAGLIFALVFGGLFLIAMSYGDLNKR